MLLLRWNGVQNECTPIWLADSSSSSGAGKTGLTISSTGLVISTRADGEATPTVYSAAASTIETIAALGTYATPTTNKCRFKEVDATNHPGMYEIQLANARFAISNARYIYITVQAAGSNVPPQQIIYDLGGQVDVRAYGGTAGNFTSGIPDVNAKQIAGVAASATKLGLELAGRVQGTVGGSFTPTTTQFECTDITDSTTDAIYLNRGILVTSGALFKYITVILGDQVGTSGRRFTVPTLPRALTATDTILVL